jgi:hypothetical protein
MPARSGIASASSRRIAGSRSAAALASITCSARFPYADIITPSEGNVANAVHDLLQQKVSTIVLADIGKLVAGTQEELEAWSNLAVCSSALPAHGSSKAATNCFPRPCAAAAARSAARSPGARRSRLRRSRRRVPSAVSPYPET